MSSQTFVTPSIDQRKSGAWNGPKGLQFKVKGTLAPGVDLESFAETLENEWTTSGLVFFAVGPIENGQVLMQLSFRKGEGKYV